MDKPINNATGLKPIVEKAVKALYGEAMQNVKIRKADRASTVQGTEGRLARSCGI